ncbi:hypothetical protein EW146_g7045 [Bondarzewia mesenterica]|uniref:Glucose-methanol-choline oxidoreductase N-terminal domain-containing protein n=1 Tax=Bondarzewia mesenterica TaxID=1095465 RepID=A0A4S4LLW8_9AGAM|nr:hypothetical protein EW146_g7045 [Bondarzewia mesenterica]
MTPAILPRLRWVQSTALPALITVLVLTVVPRRFRDHPRLVRISVAFAVANLLLRLLMFRSRAKRTKFVRDLGKVGRGVVDEYDFDEYDLVIVGGGTAGCVLASRLTEDPSIRVLVLEAGESALSLALARVPSGYSLLFGTKRVFNLYTTTQENAGAKARYWPRGKMLGGCSSVNAQIFHSGAPSDYDEWAKMIGMEGAEEWAYDNFHKYFTKFEKFFPSKSFPGVDVSHRGSTGVVETGFFGNFSKITQKFLDSCENIGISREHDLNSPKGTLGAAKLMTYIDAKGRRVTTESAYLTPDVLARPNLTVAVKASVTKLLFDTSAGQTRVTGVEFATIESGTRFRVKARKEVVLSAGAIHTPHILMLSGIGPAEHLRSHNVPVVADLPGVGAHLMDHPVIDVALRDTSGESLAFLMPRGSKKFNPNFNLVSAAIQYLATSRGPLTTNVAEAAAFFRSSDPKLFPPEQYPRHPEDSTSGPEGPDLEFFVTPMGYKGHSRITMPDGHSMGLHMVLLRPTSLGSITLRSSNPFEPPVIDPQYLSTQHDIDVLVRGMRVLTRVADTQPLAGIIDHSDPDSRFGHRLSNASDGELVEYVRTSLETLYHPTCTARMGPLSEGGVVDAHLRVHGIPNLRVVDASVFPTIVSGHTAAPTIAVAEKAADMLKEALAISRNSE